MYIFLPLPWVYYELLSKKKIIILIKVFANQGFASIGCMWGVAPPEKYFLEKISNGDQGKN